MGFFKSPYTVDGISFPTNVFCSPLAGCSDFPFRKMLYKYRPGLTFCEMVKMDALIRHDPNTYRLLDYDRTMRPIGAQLCGSKPQLAAPCAKIIEELGFDVVDLNCGCPVDKVTKDNSGSGLLKNIELIGEIVSNIVAAVSIPVTIKIRAGWDDNSIVGPAVTRIAEEAGAKIIFVHGRTREQGYKGPADWNYIKECVDAARTIQVFGNGDVVSAESAEQMFRQTGCDGVLLSRGTFGSPWLFEDIYRHFLNEPPIDRGNAQIKQTLIEHLDCIASYESEKRALVDLRRVGAWYLKKGDGVKALREIVVRAHDLKEIAKEIDRSL